MAVIAPLTSTLHRELLQVTTSTTRLKLLNTSFTFTVVIPKVIITELLLIPVPGRPVLLLQLCLLLLLKPLLDSLPEQQLAVHHHLTDRKPSTKCTLDAFYVVDRVGKEDLKGPLQVDFLILPSLVCVGI